MIGMIDIMDLNKVVQDLEKRIKKLEESNLFGKVLELDGVVHMMIDAINKHEIVLRKLINEE